MEEDAGPVRPFFERPILNSPYAEPSMHHALDKDGQPLDEPHLAKGLEYKAVAVMACDDDVLPLQDRVETVADESELDEVYDTERQLFYVACTRARDRLLISAVAPGSEFMSDLVPLA